MTIFSYLLQQKVAQFFKSNNHFFGKSDKFVPSFDLAFWRELSFSLWGKEAFLHSKARRKNSLPRVWPDPIVLKDLFLVFFVLFFGFSEMSEGVQLLSCFFKKVPVLVLWANNSSTRPRLSSQHQFYNRRIAKISLANWVKKDTHNSDFVDNLEWKNKQKNSKIPQKLPKFRPRNRHRNRQFFGRIR